MVAGQLVTEGTPSGVKAAQKGRVLEIRATDPQRALGVLKAEMEPWRVSLFGERLHVIVDGDAETEAKRLAARLDRESISTLEATSQDYSLEDVFLAIAARDEQGATKAGTA
jgi:ABC-2 type transport system ATP-binding protein